MDTVERIKIIKDYFDLNQTEMADRLNITQPNLSAILSRKREVGKNMRLRIISEFDINEDWFLTGEGKMLKDKSLKKKSISSNAMPIDNVQFMNVPFIPIHAQAGYTQGYGDIEYIDSLPTYPVAVDRTYKGKYRIFEVKGDSMDNGDRHSLYEGDKILCREVKPEYWKTRLHFRDWYFVLVTKTDGIVVKEIVSHDVENHKIKCHSLNPLFEDYEIDLADVAEIYNVIKLVDRSTRI